MSGGTPTSSGPPPFTKKIPVKILSITSVFFANRKLPSNNRLSKISECMTFQTPKMPTPWCIATAPALKQFFGPMPRFAGGLQDLCDAHAPVAADKDFAEVPWIQRGSAAKVVDPHVEPMIIAKIYKSNSWTRTLLVVSKFLVGLLGAQVSQASRKFPSFCWACHLGIFHRDHSPLHCNGHHRLSLQSSPCVWTFPRHLFHLRQPRPARSLPNVVRSYVLQLKEKTSKDPVRQCVHDSWPNKHVHSKVNPRVASKLKICWNPKGKVATVTIEYLIWIVWYRYSQRERGILIWNG